MSQYLLRTATGYFTRKRRYVPPTTSPVNEPNSKSAPGTQTSLEEGIPFDFLPLLWCPGDSMSTLFVAEGAPGSWWAGVGMQSENRREAPTPHGAWGHLIRHGRPHLPRAVPWAAQLERETLGGEWDAPHISLTVSHRTLLRAGIHTEWVITSYTC